MRSSQNNKQINQPGTQIPHVEQPSPTYKRSSSLKVEDEKYGLSSPLVRNKSNSLMERNGNSFKHNAAYQNRLQHLVRSTEEAQKTIRETMRARGMLRPSVRKFSLPQPHEGEISPLTLPHFRNANVLQMLPEEGHEQYDRIQQKMLLNNQPIIQVQMLIESVEPIQQNIAPQIIQTILQINEKDVAFYRVANIEIGLFFTQLIQMMSSLASAGKMTQEQLMSEFCWNTVSFILDICEAYDLTGIDSTVQSRSKMIKRIDGEIRNILEFIEFRYLPPREMGTSESEFTLKLRSIEQSNVQSSDIIGSSGLGQQFINDKEDYSTDIKLFLNALIRETKKVSPILMKELQEISSANIDGDQAKVPVQIEFFAMIDQSTNEYTSTDLKTMDLHMKDASLLRLCIAWVMQMYDTISQAEKYINNLSSFKSIVRGQSITLTKTRRETLIGHLKEISDRILKSRAERWQFLNNLVVELLLCVLRGFKGHDGLDRKEVMIAKLSQYIYQCLDSNILITLNLQITELNSIRKRYDHFMVESNINLITFTQPDILKYRMMGSRSQLYQMYKRLLRRKDVLTILSMKNQLETPSRDLILNVKLKDSFLVCQIQLVLKGSLGHSHIMSSLLNRIRYLRLPIIYECCSILVPLDERIGYFNDKHPVVFIGCDLDFSLLEFRSGIMYCNNRHPSNEMVHISNKIAFLCRSCNIFYKSMSFGVEFLNCQECLMTLCPRCVLNRWQGYQQVMTNKYVNTNFLREFCHRPSKCHGFWGDDELMAQALRIVDDDEYLLLLQYDYRSLKMRIVKEYEGQLIDVFLSLRQLPKQQSHDSAFNWCSIIKFKSIETVPLSSLALYQKVQINVPWYYLEQLLGENQHKQVVVCRNQRKLALIMDMPLPQTEINRILQYISIERSIQRELKKEEIQLQLSSRNLQNLSILSLINNRHALYSLNLWQNKLTSVQSLKAFTNLQELYLRENCIEDITPLLQLSSLQHLDLQRNKLNGKFPVVNFPELKNLDISCNELKDLSGLSDSCLSSLFVLKVGVNMLEELPVLDCPQLHTYFFTMNRIASLDNLCRSKLPNAKIIHGCKNRLTGALPQLSFSHLTELWLVDNFIDNIDSLANTNLAHFETLKICSNRITGKLPILNMPNLINVQLQDNDIDSIEVLAQWQTPQLKCLYLASNRIGGQLPLLNFKRLTILDLKHNKITKIDKLSSMPRKAIQQIRLGYNQISGTLPIIKFWKLTWLELQVNRIDDVMPLSMCILPQIQHLDLSQNHIRTSVPVMQFDNLVEIRLYYNAIQSLMFLREPQLLPKLAAIIIHPSQLIMPPDEEAKLRSYRFRDELMSKKVEFQRRKTYSRITYGP